jgi:hypothetical protein
MQLQHINVYLDTDIHPTIIYGLNNIVNKRVELSDTQSFVNSQSTNQPFVNGFKNGITIGELIDTLSSLCTATPNTVGKVKRFDLVFTVTNPQMNQSVLTPAGVMEPSESVQEKYQKMYQQMLNQYFGPQLNTFPSNHSF